MSDVVEENTVASVHYTGTYPDGEEFDSSTGREPLTFLVGHGQMIPGFEEEMMGASVGEKREFTLTPDKAYGERDDGLVQTVSLDQFPSGGVEVGNMGVAQSEHGQMPFTVTAVEGDQVTIDYNHQMAGKTLRFSVEVMGVRPADPEELAHGHVHGPGGHHH
jgi:FKBP-type peptidyl-prolyl cis-trans isomerase SlyD